MKKLSNPFAVKIRSQILKNTGESGSLSIRVKRDLNLKETSRTVDRWLTGENTMPIDVLVKMSKNYNISLDKTFKLG